MTATRTDVARRALSAGLAVATLGLLAACGDESEAADEPARPQVTFTADDTSIDAPDEVPSGLVDITLETEAGEVGHHIFVARLDDGVTFQEAMDDQESFFTMMTIKGGNGTIASGTSVVMTLDLEPGNYFVLDNPQNEESPTDQFTVVAGEESTAKPDAKGTVHLGPGMVIDLPDDFDGEGVWEFVNQDTEEVHEAAVVKLAAGATGEDLVEFFHGDMTGEFPVDGEFGSMGALGPGERAWIELEPGEPGDYVAVCFIPGTDGIPHIAKGMVRPFSVS
jgi:hypothetical protein